MANTPLLDPLGAYVPGSSHYRKSRSHGPLSGLTFAAKDIYDLEGSVTGCGNPDWAATHPPATADAWAVTRLLAAGADLAGKTITDELAYSLNGQNAHYGTPTNVNAPGRIPGGSSSGSAAAVAGGLVDGALGSDTGGSVRIPASYCGLYGMRPTHGRLSLQGVMPLAPSFDTVGWFARDAETFAKVGRALFDADPHDLSAPKHLLLAEDAFGLLETAVAAELRPLVQALEGRFGEATRLAALPSGDWQDLMLTFRFLQADEIQRQHRDWIEATKPTFGPEIAERFSWALSITADELAGRQEKRDAMTRHLEETLGDDSIMVVPSAPGIAPRLDATAAELRDHRSRVLGLTALAGLSGLPQVSLPLANYDGCPLGLSIIGPRHGDLALLSFVESFVGDKDSPGLEWKR